MTVALSESMKLKSGYYMPVLGLGTWELTGKKCVEIVRKAIDEGYRHIDTAAAYLNEEEIGKALKDVDRESIFITSKVSKKLSKRDVIDACKLALAKMELEYIDLYLVHWPVPGYPLRDTIEGMNMLVEKGYVRSIGLSNYSIEDVRRAITMSNEPISNLQIEYHPYRKREDFRRFGQDEGITITAYSPLARGHALGNKTLKKIAEKHEKSVGQVILRWLLQKGTIIIPKASSEKHLRENMEIFDWGLSDEEMRDIDNIRTEKSYQ